MILSEIDERILEIEENAKNSLAVASNGKTVLKSDLEQYETLIKMKALLNDPAVKANIELYQEYAAILGIKPPKKSSRSKKKNDTPAKSVVSTEPAIEPVVKKDDLVAPSTEPVVKATEAPSIVIESPVIKPAAVSDVLMLGPGQPEVKKDNPVVQSTEPVVKVTEAPVEDYSYRRTKGDIIQDLPIYDKSEQVFKDPGMSAEAIKASQEKLASIPVMSPEKAEAYVKESLGIPDIQAPNAGAPAYTGMTLEEIRASQAKLNNPTPASPSTSEYKPMTPEEIKASQEKLGVSEPASPSADGYQPMTPEEIRAAQEKLGNTPPVAQSTEPAQSAPENANKKGKKRKVAKRNGFFSWLKGPVKGYTICKGLAFLENNMRRTEEFRKINDMMLNYRLLYQSRSVEDNKKEIDTINRTIGVSLTLPINEKIKLLKRLRRIIQLTERKNKKLAKSQEQVDDLSSVIDDIDSVKLGR